MEIVRGIPKEWDVRTMPYSHETFHLTTSLNEVLSCSLVCMVYRNPTTMIINGEVKAVHNVAIISNYQNRNDIIFFEFCISIQTSKWWVIIPDVEDRTLSSFLGFDWTLDCTRVTELTNKTHITIAAMQKRKSYLKVIWNWQK